MFFGNKKAATPSERANEQLRIQERRRKVIDAVLSGASYRVAAKAAGCSESLVCRIVARALEKTAKENAGKVDLLRTLEAARLDRLQFSLWPAALKGDTRAVDALMRLLERRAKLLGLDRPAKMEMMLDVGDDEAALEQAIREVERPAGSGSGGPDEGSGDSEEPPPETTGDVEGGVA